VIQWPSPQQQTIVSSGEVDETAPRRHREDLKSATGAAGWPQAAPLLGAGWPPVTVAKLPSRNVVWEEADYRVLIFGFDDRIVGHVGLFIRNAEWNACAVKIGGIGGVATRGNSRCKAIASLAMQRAADELRDVHMTDLGLLFCDQRYAMPYRRLGWQAFEGDVIVVQPARRVHFQRDRSSFVRSHDRPPARDPRPVRSALVTLILRG
jgi:hypothetical protein